MSIAKLQSCLENLPDDLEVSWNQRMEGMFFVVDLEDDFIYKNMTYSHQDLLNLDTLLPILRDIIGEEGKLFLEKDIWEILDNLEEILETIPQEDLIVSFGANVRVACTNNELLVEERIDE